LKASPTTTLLPKKNTITPKKKGFLFEERTPERTRYHGFRNPQKPTSKKIKRKAEDSPTSKKVFFPGKNNLFPLDLGGTGEGKIDDKRGTVR